jgi:hypothetical protein
LILLQRRKLDIDMLKVKTMNVKTLMERMVMDIEDMLPKPWSTGRVKEGLFSETLDFQSLEL